MSLKEREAFLAEFSHPDEKTKLGFALLGGIFGEGIDLVGAQLIGVRVVGVGLPQICLEKDLIRDHFEQTILSGDGIFISLLMFFSRSFDSFKIWKSRKTMFYVLCIANDRAWKDLSVRIKKY